ncbi:hypothetical protein Pan216_10320 [Planctomycetes bacterium Pan216]|uniref:Uncharacterized protein n=1 Tax=Kolteria novifilia TaxID=2527975 RepID=A0A518AZS6_9BACT|nr:hypothetical protein Pan216_10320 [Planctomycetes bacterium Pan216]
MHSREVAPHVVRYDATKTNAPWMEASLGHDSDLTVVCQFSGGVGVDERRTALLGREGIILHPIGERSNLLNEWSALIVRGSTE